MTRDNVVHTVKTNVDAFDPHPRGLADEETAYRMSNSVYPKLKHLSRHSAAGNTCVCFIGFGGNS
jgi:hypothetical protein